MQDLFQIYSQSLAESKSLPALERAATYSLLCIVPFLLHCTVQLHLPVFIILPAFLSVVARKCPFQCTNIPFLCTDRTDGQAKGSPGFRAHLQDCCGVSAGLSRSLLRPVGRSLIPLCSVRTRCLPGARVPATVPAQPAARSSPLPVLQPGLQPAARLTALQIETPAGVLGRRNISEDLHFRDGIWNYR